MPDEIPGKYGGILNPRKEGDPGIPGAGRKPGTLNAKTIIRKWLEAKGKAKNPDSGQEEEMTQLDVITLKQIEKAAAGDTQAFNALLDRTEGKPQQPLTGADGSQLMPPSQQAIIINMPPGMDLNLPSNVDGEE